jgi:hypothetical protein
MYSLSASSVSDEIVALAAAVLLDEHATTGARPLAAMSSQHTASQDTLVCEVDSDDETAASVTVTAETTNTIEEMQTMMEDLSDFKTAAAAWDVTVPLHMYSWHIKSEIAELIVDITMLYSRMEHIITVLTSTVVGAPSVDKDAFIEMIGGIWNRWAELKETVIHFVNVSEKSDDDGDHSMQSDAKRARSC